MCSVITIIDVVAFSYYATRNPVNQHVPCRFRAVQSQLHVIKADYLDNHQQYVALTVCKLGF